MTFVICIGSFIASIAAAVALRFATKAITKNEEVSVEVSKIAAFVPYSVIAYGIATSAAWVPAMVAIFIGFTYASAVVATYVKWRMFKSFRAKIGAMVNLILSPLTTAIPYMGKLLDMAFFEKAKKPTAPVAADFDMDLSAA